MKERLCGNPFHRNASLVLHRTLAKLAPLRSPFPCGDGYYELPETDNYTRRMCGKAVPVGEGGPQRAKRSGAKCPRWKGRHTDDLLSKRMADNIVGACIARLLK